MSLKRIVGVIAALILALLAYAWIDGGEESLRPITQAVAPPVFTPEHGR